MKFCILVPTKDRPIDLGNLLESVKSLTRKPDLLIIIDGSDKPVKEVVDRYQEDLSIEYFTCRPPSLPKQRNAGIMRVPLDMDWVGFLDDDIVLEHDALEMLERDIVQGDNVLLKGVGLSILNQPKARGNLFNKVFLLKKGGPGKVTPSGYPEPIPTAKGNYKTDWLYGGATFWRREVFDLFSYDEWFHGTGYMEDVDFSYQVSRKYQLMISSNSKCYHFHHPIQKSKQKEMGEWQIISWWYFTQKYQNFSKGWIFWSMIGVFQKNLIGALLMFSSARLLKSYGHLRGFLAIFFGDPLKLRGFSK